jgi:hypothetical protein
VAGGFVYEFQVPGRFTPSGSKIIWAVESKETAKAGIIANKMVFSFLLIKVKQGWCQNYT